MRKALIGVVVLVLLGAFAPESNAQVPENHKICGLEVKQIVASMVFKPDDPRWKRADMLAVSSEMCNHQMPDQGVVHMANMVISITLKDGTRYFNIFHPHFAPDGRLVRTSSMFENWQLLVDENWKVEWCSLVKSDRPEELGAQGCEK